MLIIFDCDGVLRSISWEGMYVAYLHIARYANKNPFNFWSNMDEFKEWCSDDWHFDLERMGIIDRSKYLNIANIFHSIYDPCIFKFSWVDDVLSYLSMSHTLAILSSSDSLSVAKSLDASANLFSCIKGIEHVKSIKPDPEGIFLIMNEKGFEVNNSVIIGDSSADILAGKSAGIRTMGVTWGIAGLNGMKGLRPDVLIQRPQQLKFIK